MARPKPEKIFGTQPSGEIFTIEGYVKPEKPDRTVVFKTEPTGIVHTIEGYVKKPKPDRTSVFGSLGQGKPFNFGLGFSDRIEFKDLEIHSHIIRNTQSIELIMSFDVASFQTLEYGTPVRLQYAVYDDKHNLVSTLVLGYREYHNGTFVYPSFFSDSTKFTVDAWLVGDKLLRRFDVLGTTGAKEFNRISNIASKSISLVDHKEVIAPTPAEPEIEPSGQKEVPGDQAQMKLTDPYGDFEEPDPVVTPEPDPVVTPEPDPVVTPEPVDLLPYAIGIGVTIGFLSSVMKKKGAKFW